MYSSLLAWDADGDDIRCRWTDAARNECNADDGDVCGELFVDSKRRKSGALLEEVFLYYHFLIPLFTFTIHVLKF